MLRAAAAWKGRLHWATQESQERVGGLMLSHSNPSSAFPQIPWNTLRILRCVTHGEETPCEERNQLGLYCKNIIYPTTAAESAGGEERKP